MEDVPSARYGDAFSKWYAKFLAHNDLKRPDLVFYSFRHTFIDLARNADIDEAVIEVIIGHKSKSPIRGYGIGRKVETLKRHIDKVKFPFKAPILRKQIKVE